MSGSGVRRLRATAALACGALLLAACDTSGAQPPSPEVPDAGPGTYVALGDSYTAAPFVRTTDMAEGCYRSGSNYPALVAETLEVDDLRDVSCGGADTRNLARPQRTVDGQGTVPPQLDALDADADLVTLGIGGNDGHLFGSLVCSLSPEPLPLCSAGSVLPRVGPVLERTRRDVTTALRTITDRAPDALVVLVGYPRLVDPTRSCPALDLSPARLRQAARIEQRLRTALRSAARDAGVEFVDVYAASVGHEVCSDDPWVAGAETVPEKALAYHPYAVEQEAVAEMVEQLWDEAAS